MRVQKSAVEYGFNYHDRLRLQKALKQVTDKRTFLRLQAVLLFCQGMNINDVARITGKGKRAIYYWINSYLKSHQPNSLQDAPKQGRPVVAQEVTNELIVDELHRNPLDLGYHVSAWTVALLAKHLKLSYKYDITARTLRRRMKQIGLRYKRPRYVYSEKDPNRTQKKGPSSES